MKRPRQLRGIRVLSGNNVRCVNRCGGERDMGLQQGLLHTRFSVLGAVVRCTNRRTFRGFVVHVQTGIATMERSIVIVCLPYKSVIAGKSEVIGQVYST